MKPVRSLRLAVWKFASCDGCQLSLLACEEELLALLEHVTIAYFPEATRAELDGPYDISLVEGSVTTPHDVERLKQIREDSALLVSIGACASAGGIQALRNFADVGTYARSVYAHPEYLQVLESSTPIAEHVKVDHTLRGCPISKGQLLELFGALLQGRRVNLPRYSVCIECKRRGTVCVSVAAGIPCLGPVTMAGCNAICPSYRRGCFGCYGPMESPNPDALSRWMREQQGVSSSELVRAYRTFNAGADAFQRASVHEQESKG